MLNIFYSPPSSSWLSVEDELDEDELELLLDEDEELELELSFSVSELELSWFEAVLSCFVLSAELCCSDEEELSSLRSGSCLLSDDCETLSTLEDELETVETRARPSDVCVTSLTATFVAPSASTIDMIANGVNNGGVRFAISLPSFLVCFHLPILLQFPVQSSLKFIKNCVPSRHTRNTVPSIRNDDPRSRSPTVVFENRADIS